ncbi:MAG TPA: 1-acyl-sn-glycerol-3-phosphate acyltransferase [Dehalococcoidia bacterium]|nr:1-acyl-sn-glycerol-3-phosphate acyltransferase [Dehalococcoidia bacterium]
MKLFYDACNAAMRTLLIALTRWRVEGKENVPRTGPLIIVSNHLNLIDPPLLGASVPRRINFMAKQELFESTFSRLVVENYGAFPVRRGQLDRKAVRNALEQLHQGGVLGIFPEGKRSHDSQLQAAQLGASLLASRSGVPIVPVGIYGSERVRGVSSVLFQRPRITVTIGRPFILPSDRDKPTRSRLIQHSDLIMERIAELLPESYRGAYNNRRGSQGDDGED